MGGVVHASMYPDAGPREGRAAPAQTNDASLGPRSASAEDITPKMMSRCLSITSFLSQSTDGIARTRRKLCLALMCRHPLSLVPITTKSHLAIFFCKDNQWWSYLNEKVVKSATNDCLHLQNKCCVTINLSFLHLVPLSISSRLHLASRHKYQSVPLSEPQNWGLRGWY